MSSVLKQEKNLLSYRYDGDQIALDFDGNNTPRQRYLHGPQVDQVFAEESGGQTRWMLADHQGSIRQMTNNTGTLLNQIDYDSYGNMCDSHISSLIVTHLIHSCLKTN
jgi:uncharacterized protein RhaS with RHS repeats